MDVRVRPEDLLPDPSTPGGLAAAALLGPLGVLAAVPAAVARLAGDLAEGRRRDGEREDRDAAREEARDRLRLP